MKKLLLFLFASLCWIGCDQDNNLSRNVPWSVIEIPGEAVANFVYGDIDDYLLVITSRSIVRSNDGGKSWAQVLETNALPFEIAESDGKLYATGSFVHYISENEGITWEEIAHEGVAEPSYRHNEFRDSKGILYHLVRHTAGEIGLPASLLRSVDNGTSWQDILPYKRDIRHMYIDSSDRVVLGAWGAAWDESGTFTDEPGGSAYIYYSKNSTR